MNIKPLRILAAVASLGIVSSNVYADVIKSGSKVCVEETSLVALQKATLTNNEHLLNSLMDGAACMSTVTNIEVEILQASTNGNQEVRTTRKRKNLILWTHQSNLSATKLAVASSQ